MKKIGLFLLLITLLLTSGCSPFNNFNVKGSSYLYSKDEMKVVSEKIKKQVNNQKFVGRIDINAHNFSVKGVKDDGSIRFSTLEAQSPEKITDHFFTPPDHWNQAPGQRYDDDLIWDLNQVSLEIIPTLMKDVGAKLKEKADTTGKIYLHKIYVDPKLIKITYKGERKNVEYLADAQGNFIKFRN